MCFLFRDEIFQANELRIIEDEEEGTVSGKNVSKKKYSLLLKAEKNSHLLSEFECYQEVENCLIYIFDQARQNSGYVNLNINLPSRIIFQ